MHNFSISKTYSATTINTAASTNTITPGSSQLGTLAGQHSRGSFLGLSTIVYTPESPLIPATYYQQDEPMLLPDTRLLSDINASQVDPFKALATHQTVTIEDLGQEQKQLGEFPLPFDELLLLVNDFDPMTSEDPGDVNLSILPNNNDERIRNRTTISIPEQEILPSINNHFRQALSGIVPKALLTAITGDPRLTSGTLITVRGPDPTNEWIILTGDPKKPFKCGYEGCGKCYTKKTDLRLHFFKHTGNSPYKCYMGECTGKVAFCRRRELTRHIRAHHTFERPYQCEICEKRFRRSDHLKSHMDHVHVKDKKHGPFQCNICEKRFGRRNHLVRHRKSIHSQENE